MTVNIEIVLGVVAALTSAIVALWGLHLRDIKQWKKDQKEASRLIFALLGKVREVRPEGRQREKMASLEDWEDVNTEVAHIQFDKAKRAVKREGLLDPEVTKLVNDYLKSDPPSGEEQ